jgi:hypothetical protein
MSQERVDDDGRANRTRQNPESPLGKFLPAKTGRGLEASVPRFNQTLKRAKLL